MPSCGSSIPAKLRRAGVNWGSYKKPKVDALIDKAKQTFDTAKQDELLAQAHALSIGDTALVRVVHDTNPHALSPKVKTFVRAQHSVPEPGADRVGVILLRHRPGEALSSLGAGAVSPAAERSV